MALATCSVGRVRVGGALAMFLALGASLTPVPCARLAAEATPEHRPALSTADVSACAWRYG